MCVLGCVSLLHLVHSTILQNYNSLFQTVIKILERLFNSSAVTLQVSPYSLALWYFSKIPTVLRCMIYRLSIPMISAVETELDWPLSQNLESGTTHIISPSPYNVIRVIRVVVSYLAVVRCVPSTHFQVLSVTDSQTNPDLCVSP